PSARRPARPRSRRGIGSLSAYERIIPAAATASLERGDLRRCGRRRKPKPRYKQYRRTNGRGEAWHSPCVPVVVVCNQARNNEDCRNADRLDLDLFARSDVGSSVLHPRYRGGHDEGARAVCEPGDVLHGQAYLADTSLGRDLTEHEGVKVVCVRTASLPATIGSAHNASSRLR